MTFSALVMWQGLEKYVGSTHLQIPSSTTFFSQGYHSNYVGVRLTCTKVGIAFVMTFLGGNGSFNVLAWSFRGWHL